ncbi:hypothetical protein Barb7_02134 [Bacteroidales bacterium Barb7]|nr:hypothetical protein Barb7_02134 [Bacteroidales bacterium Barb7]
MAFVYHQQEVFREVVQQAVGAFAGSTSVEIAGIVFYTGAVPQFAYHFKVEDDTLVQSFRLKGFIRLPQSFHPCAQIHIYQAEGGIEPVLGSHEEVGGIDIQFVLFVNLLPCLRTERGDALYLIPPELNAVRHPVEGFNGGEYIHRIPVSPKASAVEIYLVIGVERVHETTEQLVPLHRHPLLNMYHPFGKGGRVCHTVEAGHGGDNNHIPPPRQERGSGAKAELVYLFIDSRVLFYIGVGGRQVGFRLVVVVV